MNESGYVWLPTAPFIAQRRLQLKLSEPAPHMHIHGRPALKFLRRPAPKLPAF